MSISVEATLDREPQQVDPRDGVFSCGARGAGRDRQRVVREIDRQNRQCFAVKKELTGWGKCWILQPIQF